MTPLSPRTHIKVTVSRESTIVFVTLRPSCAEGIAHVEHERRLQRLILPLPGKIQAITRWLRRPASRWARITAG
jgi:hypothetical protein